MGGLAATLPAVIFCAALMTIAVLGNGLILINVSPFYTQIIQGAIMLLAIWLNTRIFSPQRRKKG